MLTYALTAKGQLVMIDDQGRPRQPAIKSELVRLANLALAYQRTTKDYRETY